MANLNRDAAKWQLFELDERHDALVEIDCADRGNVATRLVHAADERRRGERFRESIARVQEVLPNCEVAVLSAAEIAFRWRGLEFARGAAGEYSGIVSQHARRSYLAWARRSGFWKHITKTHSRSWRTVCVILVILMDRVNIRCGGCVRRDGWSRWWSAT